MSDKGYGYILQEAAPIGWGDLAAIGILILFFFGFFQISSFVLLGNCIKGLIIVKNSIGSGGSTLVLLPLS